MGRCVRYTGVFLRQRTHLRTHSLQVVNICVYLYICVYACICVWMRMCLQFVTTDILFFGFRLPHGLGGLSPIGSPLHMRDTLTILSQGMYVCEKECVRHLYICTRVGAFCLFVLSNLSATCACITGVS